MNDVPYGRGCRSRRRSRRRRRRRREPPRLSAKLRRRNISTLVSLSFQGQCCQLAFSMAKTHIYIYLECSLRHIFGLFGMPKFRIGHILLEILAYPSGSELATLSSTSCQQLPSLLSSIPLPRSPRVDSLGSVDPTVVK